MKLAFVALAAVAALSMTSCKKEDKETKSGIFKGPEVSVHEGKAWTWVELNRDGKPERVAVSINDRALNSVPVEEGEGDHDMANSVVLKFHPKIDATLIKHVGLDWNPGGHPPFPIYTLPHFDFHFYMVTEAERMQHVDPVKLAADLPEGYLPAAHMGGDPVPRVGKHYVDLTSPELNGAVFTQTFIYGSYDAKLSFLEPMITLAFLKTTLDFVRDIPQPAKYQQTGYYPTKMRVKKVSGITNVILEGFQFKTAS
ncbi:MAG: hypothetical protein ACXWV5_08990 [Flavitalea sp.]